MDVDLILEAAVLMDKKANGNNNAGTDESQETSGNGPDKSEKEIAGTAACPSPPVEGEDSLLAVCGEEEERERERAVQDFTQSFPSSAAELPNEKHNENERKRRKMLKLSVHSLRDQLKNKTRRPAVNTVLRAAYEEIQELKKVEDEQCKVLEELKQKNIILNCYLEKQMRDIRLGKRSHPSQEESEDTHSLPSIRNNSPTTTLLTQSIVNNGSSIRISDNSNSNTSPPPPLQSIVPISNPPPPVQWFSPAPTLPFSPATLLPTLHTQSLLTQNLMQQATPTQPNVLLQQPAPPTQAPVLLQQTTPHTQPSLLPFLSYVYPNPSPILYRPTIFIPNPSPISPPSLMSVPICQPLVDSTVSSSSSLFSSSRGIEDDYEALKATTSKIPPLISINALKPNENTEFTGGQRKSISPTGKEMRLNGENGRHRSGAGIESVRGLSNGYHHAQASNRSS